MSLIEKIDEQYEIQEKYNTDYSQGIKMGLTLARDYILSEQKEPCKGCIHNDNYENELEYGYPSPCTKCKRRCIDNYQPDATDINVTTKTIGDKIRESNESLAELLSKKFVVCQDCDHWRCMSGECKPTILAYLNQPYTE